MSNLSLDVIAPRRLTTATEAVHDGRVKRTRTKKVTEFGIIMKVMKK